MKYYIRRQLDEYGPYTLAEIQRYVVSGNILLTDLARSEGMTDWMEVSQVIGNIPLAPPPGPVPAGANLYGSNVYGVPTQAAPGAFGNPAAPVPPDFHWALVLLLGLVSCTLFLWAWLFVEGSWIRKIKPESKGLLMAVLSFLCAAVNFALNSLAQATHQPELAAIGALFFFGSIGCFIIAIFMMSGDLEDYYNRVEPINLRLNGAMVFFFPVFYFQHHFSRISQWKKTGILRPQS